MAASPNLRGVGRLIGGQDEVYDVQYEIRFTPQADGPEGGTVALETDETPDAQSVEQSWVGKRLLLVTESGVKCDVTVLDGDGNLQIHSLIYGE